MCTSKIAGVKSRSLRLCKLECCSGVLARRSLPRVMKMEINYKEACAWALGGRGATLKFSI